MSTSKVSFAERGFFEGDKTESDASSLVETLRPDSFHYLGQYVWPFITVIRDLDLSFARGGNLPLRNNNVRMHSLFCFPLLNGFLGSKKLILIPLDRFYLGMSSKKRRASPALSNRIYFRRCEAGRYGLINCPGTSESNPYVLQIFDKFLT